MELTKKKAKELLAMKGEARGVTIKTDWTYVKENYGEEGLKKVEKKIAELGYPLKYEEINVMDYYPIGVDALSMLLIKELFGFNEQDLINMGRNAIKFSIFLKVILRHFASLDLFAKEGAKMWGKHYTVGEMKIEGVDYDKKKSVIELKNFKLLPEAHQVFMTVFKGYMMQILEMVTGSQATCKQTKDESQGDDLNQFVVWWDKNSKES